LAFIDDQKAVEKTLNLKDLKSLLFSSWQKLGMPDEINQNHCQFCEYRGLCFPSS
jgi:CRISPR/Cas system-associated exonuclease Cas4 (RecB family)